MKCFVTKDKLRSLPKMFMACVRVSQKFQNIFLVLLLLSITISYISKLLLWKLNLKVIFPTHSFSKYLTYAIRNRIRICKCLKSSNTQHFRKLLFKTKIRINLQRVNVHLNYLVKNSYMSKRFRVKTRTTFFSMKSTRTSGLSHQRKYITPLQNY